MVKANSYQKGNKYELEVKKYLESQGWIVFKQHRKPVYINKKMIMLGCDIFGCDIVAKKVDCKPLWVQVSTTDNLHKKIQQVNAFPWNYYHEDLQIWCRISGKLAYKVYSGPRFKDPSLVEVK